MINLFGVGRSVFGVRRFPVSAREPRILIGKFLALGKFLWLTRFVILRLLGFVYAIAFLVAANQIVPLVREAWIDPASIFSTWFKRNSDREAQACGESPHFSGSESRTTRC
jgi:hypothetical protein